MANINEKLIGVELWKLLEPNIPQCSPKQHAQILAFVFGCALYSYRYRHKLHLDDAFTEVFVELLESQLWGGNLTVFWTENLSEKFMNLIKQRHDEKRLHSR